MNLTIVGVAVAITLIAKATVEISLRHSGRGNDVMRDCFADVREAIAELPNLDVQSGFVVANEFTGICIWVKAARAKENVAQNCLMTAEYAGIVVAHDERITTVVEAEQCVATMLEDPYGWLGLPPRNYATRHRGNIRFHREGLDNVPQEIRIGEHVVVGEIKNFAERYCRAGIACPVRAATRLHQSADPREVRRKSLDLCGRIVSRFIVNEDDLETIGWITLSDEALDCRP